MNISQKKLQKAIFTIIFCLGLMLFLQEKGVAVSSNEVHIIQLNDDTINPITAEYITKSIDTAENENAQCLIIKLDTPGGLLNSTRLIVKRILSSKIPVIVYVAPSGSRAGSAGVFITYASHIAAMAPSTNIGAAHPVQMNQRKEKQKDIWDGLDQLLKTARKSKDTKEEGGGEEGKKEERKSAEDSKSKEDEPKDQVSEEEEIVPDEDPMSSKILQDTVAFIKAIAQKRNRNVEWAIKSVTKSSSITETEALELGVIEIIAKNEKELLEKLDGRSVIIDDKTHVLATKNASIKRIEMDSRQKLLNILANPNIAYILMILGFYGLMYEVTHPGFGVPGVLGTIFLILAFYSMQTLPTNYAGLALIILGLVLFIAEAFAPGFGILTLGGVASMILGSLILFDSSVPIMKVSLPLILSFTLTTAAIAIFLVSNVIKSHRKKVISGKEGLIGEEGEVIKIISKGKDGKVFVHGELWNASGNTSIKKGEKIIVVEVKGLILTVKKA